jgi:hypothetical protein
MPQLCRICNHPQREAIDAELSRDWERSLRAIGQEYGVSKDALLRHSRAHLEIVEDEITGNGNLADDEGQKSVSAAIHVDQAAPADEPRQANDQEDVEPSVEAEQEPTSERDELLAKV